MASRQYSHRNNNGFTIVELLIVIVVIAILAAISIVAYNGVQNRARESSLKTTLSQAKKSLMLHKVVNSTYPTSNNQAEAGVEDANDITYEYTSDGESFCLTATLDVGLSWYISDTGSFMKGACTGHVVDGSSPITNISINPRAEWTYGWDKSTTAWLVTKSEPISGHPMGLTQAVKARKSGWLAASCIMGIYNVDGLANSPIARTLGVWVYVEQPGYYGRATDTGSLNSGPQVPLAPSTWTYVQSGGSITGYSAVRVCLQSGADANYTDEAWATGSMVVEGSDSYSYADGDSSGWAWSGTPGRSSSNGPGN